MAFLFELKEQPILLMSFLQKDQTMTKLHHGLKILGRFLKAPSNTSHHFKKETKQTKKNLQITKPLVRNKIIKCWKLAKQILKDRKSYEICTF